MLEMCYIILKDAELESLVWPWLYHFVTSPKNVAISLLKSSSILDC